MTDAHPTVELRSGDVAATFVPSLAMLGSSLTDGGVQLLELRGGVEAYAERGSTMGVPLLHPWANRIAEPRYEVAGREVTVDMSSPLVHTDGNGLAIHGCHPAAMPFTVTEHDDGHLVAVLDTGEAPAVLELFPFPHRLTMEAALAGRTLTITSTLEATGDTPVPVAFGHHPYLRLPDVPRDEWQIDLPQMSRLELDGLMIPTGRRLPRGLDPGPLAGRDLDDAFADVADGATFAVSGGRPHDHRPLPRGLPVRPGLLARRPDADLLRADDRARQRTAQRRRPAAARAGRAAPRLLRDRALLARRTAARAPGRRGRHPGARTANAAPSGTAASTSAIAMFASSANEHTAQRTTPTSAPSAASGQNRSIRANARPIADQADRPPRGPASRTARRASRPANGAPSRSSIAPIPASIGLMCELVTYCVSEIACSTARMMIGPVTSSPCGSPAVDQRVPQLLGALGRQRVDLVARLPAPAGVRDHRVHAGDLHLRAAVARQRRRCPARPPPARRPPPAPAAAAARRPARSPSHPGPASGRARSPTASGRRRCARTRRRPPTAAARCTRP